MLTRVRGAPFDHRKKPPAVSSAAQGSSERRLDATEASLLRVQNLLREFVASAPLEREAGRAPAWRSCARLSALQIFCAAAISFARARCPPLATRRSPAQCRAGVRPNWRRSTPWDCRRGGADRARDLDLRRDGAREQLRERARELLRGGRAPALDGA